jgi:hypothetical protein
MIVSRYHLAVAVKAASRDDLAALSWLPDKVADAVWNALHAREDT